MKIEKRLITDEGVTITFKVVDGKMAIRLDNRKRPAIFTLNLASDEIVDFTREIAAFFSENKGIKTLDEPSPAPLSSDELSDWVDKRLDLKEPLKEPNTADAPYPKDYKIDEDNLPRLSPNDHIFFRTSTFNNPFKK